MELDADEVRAHFFDLLAGSNIVILPELSGGDRIYPEHLCTLARPLPLYQYYFKDGALRAGTETSWRGTIKELLTDPPAGVVLIEDAHRFSSEFVKHLKPKLTAWILQVPRSEVENLLKGCPAGHTTVIEDHDQRAIIKAYPAWHEKESSILSKKGAARMKEVEKIVPSDHAIVIEVDSGDYFVGTCSEEAEDRARQAYPGKLFYFYDSHMRIG